jgi:hypothetical protein
VGKPLGHDHHDHSSGTTSLDEITIKDYKSNSKFDCEIRVARDFIGVI